TPTDDRMHSPVHLAVTFVSRGSTSGKTRGIAARQQCEFFSAAPRAGLGAVWLPPVIPLGEHRFAWMRASPIFEITPVVGVTHHGAPIPGDPTDDTSQRDSPNGARRNASHCRCTSRSATVGIMPEGANILDGTGSSSVS